VKDSDLRCMRWPLGLLCLLDCAAGGCRWPAICCLHNRVFAVAWRVGMHRGVVR